MIKNFREWLKNNTSLLPRTRRQYVKVIRQFLSSYGEINIDNINDFLQKDAGYFYRFAFRHFLKFLDRKETWESITKIKRKPKRRYGVYIDKEKILDMVKHIRENAYYIVAKIQYLTGTRTHDVFRLKKNSIYKKEDSIILHLITKGEREHIVAIPFPEAKEIVDFIESSDKEYPFLKGKSDSLVKWVDNNYRYYYEEIRRVSELVGIKGFRPHDFRRNFANDVYMGSRDVLLVRDVLGHKNLKYTTDYLQRLNVEEETKKAIEKFRR